MGANSKIEWCHHTFNPWIGCTKVSDGCKNCYAEEMMDHRYGRAQWGPGGTRVRTSEANWKKPLQWDKAAAAAGERHRVFCASLADVFEDRPELDQWLADLFWMIYRTQHLDWLLLTKRIERVMAAIEEVCVRECHMAQDEAYCQWLADWAYNNKPPHNVWIGTSVENQEQADKRIPELLKIPAKVRFLSMEPLLGPVDIAAAFPRHLRCSAEETVATGNPCIGHENGIHWVIVGGESGRNARPMHPDWARYLRDQCQAAGVPFFFKQWGEWREVDGPRCQAPNSNSQAATHWLESNGDLIERFSDSKHRSPYFTVMAAKLGKHTAGRTIDGRTWDEVPEVTS